MTPEEQIAALEARTRTATDRYQAGRSRAERLEVVAQHHADLDELARLVAECDADPRQSE